MNHAQKPSNPHPGTILVVDDDVEAVQLTRRIITGVCPQFCVKVLQSGEELVSYLKGEHGFSDRLEFPYPTLILLDLSMPVMHGFEVLAWLASHPPHHRIPVVVLTGSGEVQVAQRSYVLGARSFLTKPLQAAELKETLDAVGKYENRLGQAPPPGERPPEL